MTDTSIIMAAHNEENHLERALRSCLAQSLPCEIVLVNDGSTDNTGVIAERFADRITLITNPSRQGLQAAVNRAIRAAEARYVVRVDADDYVHTDFARVLRLYLELDPTLDSVACDYLTVDEREAHLEHVSAEREPIGCGIMFRKDRLVEAGLYSEAGHPEFAERRVAASLTPFYCRMPLYRYRRHPGSMTWAAA